MRNAIITLLLILFCKTINAQYLIEGIALDTKNAPIAGVNILVNPSVVAVTNYDGYFKLSIPDVGIVKLIIRFIGYIPLDGEIDIEKGYLYKVKAVLGKVKRNKKNSRSTFSVEKVKVSNN